MSENKRSKDDEMNSVTLILAVIFLFMLFNFLLMIGTLIGTSTMKIIYPVVHDIGSDTVSETNMYQKS